MSRRQLISGFLLLLLMAIALPPIPHAIALGGKQPPLNQPAPAFTLPTNTDELQ